jgi:hypothetical protein
MRPSVDSTAADKAVRGAEQHRNRANNTSYFAMVTKANLNSQVQSKNRITGIEPNSDIKEALYQDGQFKRKATTPLANSR